MGIAYVSVRLYIDGSSVQDLDGSKLRISKEKHN